MTDTRGWLSRPAQALPGAARDMTQFVVDNPAQSVVLVSGAIVLTRALANIVRPRNPLEALALLFVSEALCIGGAAAVVRSGLMPLRARDADGCVFLIGGKPDAAAAP